MAASLTNIEELRNERSLKKYFDTLSFFDLINETHITLEKLKGHPFDKRVAIESRSLIGEISKRIDTGSFENKSTLISIEKNLNEKFLDIDLIF